MEVIYVGPYRSGKGVGGTYSSFCASEGKPDKILYRSYPIRYRTYTNCQFKWLSECNKPGGNLNPIDAPSMGKQGMFGDYTTIYIHEAHRWFDSNLTSRLTKIEKQRRLDAGYYLADESGKRHFNLIFDCQNREKLDNRLREAAGMVVKCKNFAIDVENEQPILRYQVIMDPESEDPYGWEVYPDKKFTEFIHSLYNSWETPGMHETEVDRLYGSKIMKQEFMSSSQVRKALNTQ